jgi:riboflavin kinase/FMN adenylyltransferase
VHHHASEFLSATNGSEPTVLTVGTFDGVHMGHRAVIKQLQAVAARHNASTTLLSFHPHPRVVLDPEHHGLKLLNTLSERQALLESTGLDHLVLHPFTTELSQLTPWEYAKTLLGDCIKPVAVVIGDDHRFGRHRSGNFSTLQTLGEALGFEVLALEAQTVDDIRVSSTKVREALKHGNVEEANLWLGSRYPTTGRVVHGEALGRTLGYPTANLDVEDPLKLLPARGVYAVWCQLPDGAWHPAMANVGLRPTVSISDTPTLEVHVIGQEGDWYGQQLNLRWVAWMRGEVEFASTEELKLALDTDLSRATQLLLANPNPHES